MSAGLVTLKGKDPLWGRRGERVFVGKDVLELLSSSMYVNPLTMYREYIQNAADAYDASRGSQGDSVLAPGRVDIKIDQQMRAITITDFAHGLEEAEFFQCMMSIGGSRKRGTSARGFRGVGRLAGLAYCQELVFRTRPKGANTVLELKWDSRKIRNLLRSHDLSLDLAGIVSETVECRSAKPSGSTPHFFEVEMRGVVRHGNDVLLDPMAIAKYLAQVAPVPFKKEFSFGREISKFLDIFGVANRPLHIEVDGAGRVYRPHSDEILLVNGKTIRLTDLETFVVTDRDGNPAAASRILHHEYNGALPPSTLIPGWRFRFGDIQVGSNNLAEHLFSETRFNSWSVAESHVLDRRIIPNGRRDDFEHSAFYSDLMTRLTPHARNISQLCRSRSIARNLWMRIDKDLERCEEQVTIAAKKQTPKAISQSLAAEAEVSLAKIATLLPRASLNESQRGAVSDRIRRVRHRITLISRRTNETRVLGTLPPAQRRLLQEVFEVIHASTGSAKLADELINRIIVRLRRKASRSGAAKH